jgi:hypothetical protein
MDKKNLNPYTFDDLGGNLLVCRGNMLLGLALLIQRFFRFQRVREKVIIKYL